MNYRVSEVAATPRHAKKPQIRADLADQRQGLCPEPWIQAGQQTITDADPPPADLHEALTAIRQASGA